MALDQAVEVAAEFFGYALAVGFGLGAVGALLTVILRR